MTKLTALGVKNAKPGRNRYGAPDRAAYADGDGLYLIVQPTGAKTFTLRYRFNGRTRNLRLGDAGEADGALTLVGARAAEARLMVERGVDPAERRAPAGPDRVEALVEQFLDRHVRRKTRTSSAKA